MGTDIIPIETLGAEIKARVEAGDKALDKAEQHYIAAGIQLAEAKKRLTETREMAWSLFLKTHCSVRRRRADELIALGEGRTSLAEMREKNRERVAAHRERRKSEPALRNAASLSLVADTAVASALRNAELAPPPDGVGALMSAWNDADRDTRDEFMRQACLVPKNWLEDAALELLIMRKLPIPGGLAESRWSRLGLEPPAEAPTPYTASERRPCHYEVDKKTGKYTKVDDPDFDLAKLDAANRGFVKGVIEIYTNGMVNDDGRVVRKPDPDDTLTDDQIPAFLKKDAA